ncbi:MAG: glycosyltransferase family 39 protein [Bacteroidales bacterium]|nr:glycosyltransferase family 39 protein [Bacteroidales bacterium]
MANKKYNLLAKTIAFVENNRHILFLCLICIIALRFVWLNYINYYDGSISNGLPGVKYWLDTDRYIGGAEKLLAGIELHGREYQFIGYMLFIAAIKLFGLPVESIVFVQIFFAIIASFAIFNIVASFTKSKFAALFSVALFVCNPFVVRWHLYILTESLYMSFVILSLWAMLRLLNRESWRNYLLSAIIVALAALIRPNGWIIVPIFLISIIFCLKLGLKYKLISSVVVLSLIFIVPAGLSGLKNSIQITTPIDNLQQGITVWGHPELNIRMPQEPEMDSKDWTSGIKYIIKHPFYVIKLGAMRIYYTIVHVRPYNSDRYNLRVLLWILPAYFLSLISLIKIRKQGIIAVSLAIILGHLFVVAVSYAEHDSRFDVYILPVFYVLAGVGINSFFALFYKRV